MPKKGTAMDSIYRRKRLQEGYPLSDGRTPKAPPATSAPGRKPRPGGAQRSEDSKKIQDRLGTEGEHGLERASRKGKHKYGG